MLCFLFCFSSCCVPHVASFFELSNFDFPLVLSNVYFITYTGPFTVLDSGTSIKSGWIKARNVDFIAKVKTELRKRKNISQVPKHYEIGPRKLNIVLTWLRCFASFLNYDLFQANSLWSVLSLWCQSRRLLSFLLRLFPLFKHKTYIISKLQLAT